MCFFGILDPHNSKLDRKIVVIPNFLNLKVNGIYK